MWSYRTNANFNTYVSSYLPFSNNVCSRFRWFNSDIFLLLQTFLSCCLNEVVFVMHGKACFQHAFFIAEIVISVQAPTFTCVVMQSSIQENSHRVKNVFLTFLQTAFDSRSIDAVYCRILVMFMWRFLSFFLPLHCSVNRWLIKKRTR